MAILRLDGRCRYCGVNSNATKLYCFSASWPPRKSCWKLAARSRHWGRVLGELGHQVRLIPAQYVKPSVKRSKNDRDDAKPISEAAALPRCVLW